MKFSERWLRELVNLPVNTKELIEDLSMIGLEVESCHPFCKPFSNVVTARIIKIMQHPNADKLKICTVFDGNKEFEVVCGASNVFENAIVAFARIGAKLADNTIQKTELRGILSEGMLCSASELGLFDDNSGLLIFDKNTKMGEDVFTYAQCDDNIIEINITPNRGDALSLNGIARDLSALYNSQFNGVNIVKVPQKHDDQVNIEIKNNIKCPYYSCVLIKNINMEAQTPLWMKQRLMASGIRSIDIIVDITNFVMIELGAPLHAFDYDEIGSQIIIRESQEHEELILLNDQAIKLQKSELLITNKDNILALAGVMGGKLSGISKNTKHIILEAALFSQIALAGAARKYALHTDASLRFERGVDIAQVENALHRATELIHILANGEPCAINVVNHFKGNQNAIKLTFDHLIKHLGLSSDIAADVISKTADILSKLGFKILHQNPDFIEVLSPTHRYDVTIPEDLIEEVARIYGYNNLNESLPTNKGGLIKTSVNFNQKQTLSLMLASRGLNEVITYTFIEENFAKLFTDSVIALQNPISQDLSVMRPYVFASLLKTIEYNVNYQQNRNFIFEIGKRFSGNLDNVVQEDMLAIALTGDLNDKGWLSEKRDVNFYDLKSLLAEILGDNLKFTSTAELAFMHPGQTAKIYKNCVEIGFIGQVHPTITNQLDINKPVFVAELNINLLIENLIVQKFTSVSKMPTIKRDLSLFASKDTQVEEIIYTIEQAKGKDFIVDITIFDVYTGAGIADDCKSIALRISWQHHEKTLSDEEINEFIEDILQLLSKINVSLRL